MSGPQFIKSPSGEEMVVIARDEYEALVRAAEEAAEDAEDVAIYDARKRELAAEKPLPAEISLALLEGKSRLRALREWRGISLEELASRSGLPQGRISEVEMRRRPASADLAGPIAQALKIPVAWIAD